MSRVPTPKSAFYFFDRCVDPRKLHSFPTRRSSDLRNILNKLKINFYLRIVKLHHLTWCHLHTIIDRKSTRLNSSHVEISYAVFCLKKKISALLANVTDIHAPRRAPTPIAAAPTTR